MKKLLLCLVALSMLDACTKEEPCEENDFGWLKFTVPSTETWDLFVDGVHVAQVGGGQSTIKQLPSGKHNVKYVYAAKTDSSEEVVNIPQCMEVQRFK
jgi:hypothetical protein